MGLRLQQDGCLQPHTNLPPLCVPMAAAGRTCTHCCVITPAQNLLSGPTSLWPSHRFLLRLGTQDEALQGVLEHLCWRWEEQALSIGPGLQGCPAVPRAGNSQERGLAQYSILILRQQESASPSIP